MGGRPPTCQSGGTESLDVDIRYLNRHPGTAATSGSKWLQEGRGSAATDTLPHRVSCVGLNLGLAGSFSAHTEASEGSSCPPARVPLPSGALSGSSWSLAADHVASLPGMVEVTTRPGLSWGRCQWLSWGWGHQWQHIVRGHHWQLIARRPCRPEHGDGVFGEHGE